MTEKVVPVGRLRARVYDVSQKQRRNRSVIWEGQAYWKRCVCDLRQFTEVYCFFVRRCLFVVVQCKGLTLCGLATTVDSGIFQNTLHKPVISVIEASFSFEYLKYFNYVR